MNKRAVVVALLFGACSRLTIDERPDAPVDVSGVPCRAATVDDGIEYDCTFADELGVCAGDVAYPTCHERCPTIGACMYGGRPHTVIARGGIAICYCE